jgi:hypothetical protein
VRTGDRWLKRHIEPLLTSPALAGGVVFVVFDEGSSAGRGGGEVAARTSHYGLLRTIEGGLGLPFLGSSRSVEPIVGIWRLIR